MSDDMTTNELSIADLIKSTSYGAGNVPPSDDFDFGEDVVEGIRLPFPKTPQKTSNWEGVGARDLGTLFIDHNEKGEDTRTHSKHTEDFNFILVDVLTDTQRVGTRSVTTGSRRMKNSDPKAENWLLCSSPNGVAPYHGYVNEVLPYPSENGQEQEFVIGQDSHGDWIEEGQVCLQCPFASWELARALGRKAPPCVEGYDYVIWSQEYGLMKVGTPNLSMHFALTGNAKAFTKDGDRLNGITKFFKKNDKPIERQASSKELTEDHLAWVVSGEAKDGSVQKLERSLLLQNDPKSVVAILKNNFVKVNMEIPTYPFAPEGLPSVINPDAKVKKVKMMVEENNNNNSAFVFQFILSDEDWSQEDWEAFTAEKELYKSDEYREKLMRTEDYVNSAKEKIGSVNVHVLPAGASQSQLPSGNNPPWAVDVLEGDVEDTDDDGYEL